MRNTQLVRRHGRRDPGSQWPPWWRIVQPFGEELKTEFKSLHDEIHELRTTISALTQREDKLQQTLEALAALVASALKKW